MVLFKYHEQAFEVPGNVSMQALLLPVKVNNKVTKIKALDPYWIKTNRFYPCYVPYDIHSSENSTYINKNQRYLSEVTRLLSMTYHEFICYIIYEPKIPSMLDSFMMHAAPSYEFENLHPTIKEFYMKLYVNTIKVYLRLFQTDKIQFVDRTFLLQMIIDSHVIHLGTLIDMCRLYGKGNCEMVQHIMEVFYNEKRIIFSNSSKVLKHCMEELGCIEIKLKNVELPSEGKLCIREALDLLQTISSFIRFYKAGYEHCLNLDFLSRLRSFFDVIPQCYHFADDAQDGIVYKKFLKCIRFYICNIYNSVNCHLINAMNKNCDKVEQVVKNLTIYLTELRKSFADVTFYNDFKMLYDIEEQLTCAVSIYTNSGGTGLESDIQDIYDILSAPAVAASKPLVGEQCTKNEEQWQAIYTVKETLPHLTDGFIRECLEKHDFNPEIVVNMLLESSPETKSKQAPQPRSKRGAKSNGYEDALDLLEDKSFVREMKQRNDDYAQYGVGLDRDVSGDCYYDDDYDDSYDDRGIAVYEAKTELDEELWTRNTNAVKKLESSESDESDDAGETAPKDPKAFCEDPAVARARREAKYSDRNREVVGRPKGQGQDQKVQRNRNQKNVHKSTGGNHNRRGGAQWKRSRAMIPS